MCISPNRLVDGTLIACRKCRLCRDNIIKDWAGRCIAEAETTQYAYWCLLTYGDERIGDLGKIRAVCLTYSDVQKYFKRLWKKIGKFKYFIVGEYGSSNDRAHWHLLIFSDNPLPDVQVDGQLRNQGDWKLGFSSFNEFHYRAAYYCCKYLFKDANDDLKVAEHYMSKKPPIGHEWFQQLAEKYVDAGLAPQDLFYTFPGVVNKEGRPIKYLMKNKTAENFLTHYVNKWQEKYGRSEPKFEDIMCGDLGPTGGRFIPSSDLVEAFLDKRIAKWTERSEGWHAYWELQGLMAEQSDEPKDHTESKNWRRKEDKEQEEFLRRKWELEGYPKLEEHLNEEQAKIGGR